MNLNLAEKFTNLAENLLKVELGGVHGVCFFLCLILAIKKVWIRLWVPKVILFKIIFLLDFYKIAIFVNMAILVIKSEPHCCFIKFTYLFNPYGNFFKQKIIGQNNSLLQLIVEDGK